MGRKEVHIFPEGICLKVNLIGRREFKPAYFEAVVNHFSHYATYYCLVRISIINYVKQYRCVQKIIIIIKKEIVTWHHMIMSKLLESKIFT